MYFSEALHLSIKLHKLCPFTPKYFTLNSPRITILLRKLEYISSFTVHIPVLSVDSIVFFSILFFCIQPRCPPTGEWLNNLWYVHTMEHYSATFKTKLPIHTTDNLQRVMSEKQTQKITYTVLFHFIKFLKVTKLLIWRTDSWLPGKEVWVGKEVEWL